MTKRKELLKQIRKYAKQTQQDLIIKEGGNHTKVQLGEDHTTFLPRHTEIENELAKTILRQLGMR